MSFKVGLSTICVMCVGDNLVLGSFVIKKLATLMCRFEVVLNRIYKTI
jgi:hypothetical protein